MRFEVERSEFHAAAVADLLDDPLLKALSVETDRTTKASVEADFEQLKRQQSACDGKPRTQPPARRRE